MTSSLGGLSSTMLVHVRRALYLVHWELQTCCDISQYNARASRARSGQQGRGSRACMQVGQEWQAPHVGPAC